MLFKPASCYLPVTKQTTALLLCSAEARASCKEPVKNIAIVRSWAKMRRRSKACDSVRIQMSKPKMKRSVGIRRVFVVVVVVCHRPATVDRGHRACG